MLVFGRVIVYQSPTLQAILGGQFPVQSLQHHHISLVRWCYYWHSLVFSIPKEKTHWHFSSSNDCTLKKPPHLDETRHRGFLEILVLGWNFKFQPVIVWGRGVTKNHKTQSRWSVMNNSLNPPQKKNTHTSPHSIHMAGRLYIHLLIHFLSLSWLMRGLSCRCGHWSLGYPINSNHSLTDR